jgi:phytoene dehydrogenase-like protein
MSQAMETFVVGGGIAGLIASIDLARGGARVKLFEKSPALGGRALSRETDGFVFNQGPHALYNGGVLRQTLAEFQVQTSGGPPPFRQPAALWGDKRFPLPLNFRTILAAAPLSLAERWRLLSFFLSMARLDLAPWRGRPLAEFTAPLPARLRDMMHALMRVTTSAHAPDRLDAAAALAQLRMGGRGVTYLDGGWRVIVDGLARVARQAGVEIRLDAPIGKIERADGRWRVGGLMADAVVLAAPPETCASLLPVSKSLAAAARDAVPIRAISLDYGLRRLPRPQTTFVLGVDAPLYFSVHSESGRLAPNGGALLHAARYLGPEEAVGTRLVEEVQAFVGRLQPGFEREIVHSNRLLGMPVAFDTPRAERGGRMAPVSLDDAPGVFICGDWVGEGAMLSDAAAKSARKAAAAALTGAKHRVASPAVA